MTSGCFILLQARMGSTRLPRKVLESLCGRTLLGHCIARLVVAGIGPVVVATTTNPEDDEIVMEAERQGVVAFRGSADDVLGRFAGALDCWNEPFVVRATADNPAVDIDAPRRVLKRLAAGADYVVEAGLPVGAAVEAIRAGVLRTAAEEARTGYDREHVTPFVKTRPERFRIETPAAPPALCRPEVRLTVDTPDDLEFMRRVLAQVDAGAWPPPLTAILEAVDRAGLSEEGQ